MKKILLILLFWAWAFGGESYELVWLGDMHYDGAGLHDEETLEKMSAKQKKAVARNLHSWDGESAPSRRLLALAGEAARGADFAFQIGDFAHGHAGSQERAQSMYSEAIATIRGHFGVPFYFAVGNHEYKGKGADEALKSTLLPYLNHELNATLRDFNFAFSHKGDAYIFWDSARPNLAWLKAALTAHKGARYTFVVTHFPLLPVGEGRVGWIPFAKDAAQRRELLDTLAKASAVVLCGHIHEQTLLEYASPKGKITQIAAYSLFAPSRPEINGEIKEGGHELYEAKKSVRKALENGGELGEMIAEYVPFVTRYAQIEGAGYCRLKISDDGIINEFRVLGETRIMKVR